MITVRFAVTSHLDSTPKLRHPQMSNEHVVVQQIPPCLAISNLSFKCQICCPERLWTVPGVLEVAPLRQAGIPKSSRIVAFEYAQERQGTLAAGNLQCCPVAISLK